MTTPGKYRHLARAATAAGHFIILAIDHRLNLTPDQAQSGGALPDSEVSPLKQQIVAALMPAGASALLTDPRFGLAPGLRDGWLPTAPGLLAPLEETDYSLHPSQRRFRTLPGWSPAAIQRMGADGVKMLIYYHPEAPDAGRQREAAERVITACAKADIPLYLEPIAFSLDPEQPLPPAERTDIVIESARLFSGMGIDVLKSEFPVDVAEQPDEAIWKQALARLDEASRTPWALLSAGVPYEVFRRQVALACEAGASGIIAGRAVWAEVVTLPTEAREAYLQTTARDRMSELAGLVAAHGRDFRARTAPPPAFGPAWLDAS